MYIFSKKKPQISKKEEIRPMPKINEQISPPKIEPKAEPKITEPAASSTSPVLGPYDFWCKLDKNTGIFAVVDNRMNIIWKGGTAVVPKVVKAGRYAGKDLVMLNVEIQDNCRWGSLLDMSLNNSGTFTVDIVDIKKEDKNEKRS